MINYKTKPITTEIPKRKKNPENLKNKQTKNALLEQGQ